MSETRWRHLLLRNDRSRNAKAILTRSFIPDYSMACSPIHIAGMPLIQSQLENIEGALREADTQFVRHPRECIDCLTVSDLATWSASKMTFLSPLLPFYDKEIKK